MKAQVRRTEKGQILILLTIAIVVLIGFTALAVDGGMVYSDRRYAQSAADASSLAAAGAAANEMESTTNHLKVIYTDFPCNVGTLPTVDQTKYGTATSGVLAAINSAKSTAQSTATINRFTIGTNLSTNHGVIAQCGIKNMGGYYEKFIDITVMITSETPTTFAQVIFGGKLKNTVTSVVRVRPTNTLAYGYAIASLDSSCAQYSGGIDFSGTEDVTVNGGGIWSNSCITKGGSGNILVTNTDTGINYLTQWKENGNSGSISPTPTHVTDPIPEWDPPFPPCANIPDRGSFEGGTASIQPGRYSHIKLNNNQTLKFQPGLYCLSGDFDMTGGTVLVDSVGTCKTAANGSLDGVTIFLSSGAFNVPGSATINLQANSSPPPENANYQCRLLSGMLIYAPSSNASIIRILGNSSSSYRGTIYGPKSTIEAGGSSTEAPTLTTQLIGRYVFVHGKADININFNGADNYLRPALMDMLK